MECEEGSSQVGSTEWKATRLEVPTNERRGKEGKAGDGDGGVRERGGIEREGGERGRESAETDSERERQEERQGRRWAPGLLRQARQARPASAN